MGQAKEADEALWKNLSQLNHQFKQYRVRDTTETSIYLHLRKLLLL